MSVLLSRLLLFGLILKSTILHASNEETNQVIRNSYLLLEPKSVAIGVAVSAALALIATVIYIAVKMILRLLKYKPSTVGLYMRHTSSFIKKPNSELHEFWNGTPRMKVSKLLLDMLLLLIAMTLVRAITLVVIKEGFLFSYNFINSTIGIISTELGGANLSANILSVFVLIMIVRFLEHKTQTSSKNL